MPPQMGFSRTALIEKLMKEDPLDDSSEKVPIEEERFHPRKRVWTDLNSFIKDNLLEVEQKLSLIETQIWGKLIVMERNYRTAKAYLRNSTITVDGSTDEFDGIKLGLSHFNNDSRDTNTEMELKTFSKGLRVHLDEAGNVWMKKNALFERCVAIKTRQRRECLVLTDSYQKIFDLRRFKESIIASLTSSAAAAMENFDKKRLKESTAIFVKLTDTMNDDCLKIPVWCCLIHLIAFDMVNVIANEFGYHPNQAVLPLPLQQLSIQPHLQQQSAHAPIQIQQQQLQLSSNSSNASSANEDSSVASSSYQNSSSSGNRNNNSNQKSGVAKRIFQQRKPQQTSHYSCPLNVEESRDKGKPRSKSQSRSFTASASSSMTTFQQRHLSPPRSLPQSSLNGWSLLNLSDIDKLKTPAYFTSREEAGSRRCPIEAPISQNPKKSKKSRSKSKNRQEQLNELQKYKWLSETCLKNL